MRNLVIYEPSGPAREAAELAVNVYRGCDHHCQYCYVPGLQHVPREQLAEVRERNNFLAKLEADAQSIVPVPDRPISLCFACDPYCRFDIEHGITREAIEILHAAGHKVRILTKGGTRACRDLDLMGPGDSFGCTLTFSKVADSLKWEPGAALPIDRMKALRISHEAGISTFANMEPVIDPAQSLALIDMSDGHPVAPVEYAALADFLRASQAAAK